ncbi:MAG TPA: hypothetical protein VGH19_15750 [Verrucomicrobiae bacterium]
MMRPFMCKHNFSTPPGIRWSAATLLLFVFCLSAGAQPSLAAEGNPKGKGKSKPKVSERPQVIGAISSTTKPLRPSQAGGGTETSQLVAQFQSARNDYLEAQKELKIAKGTELNEEQRAVLREKSKDALNRWREDHRQFTEEQQERLKTIKAELQTDLAQRVDSVREDTTGGRGR